MISSSPDFVKYFLDMGSDFRIFICPNWGIVQWQDGRLWICLSGFESLSPSQVKAVDGLWFTVHGVKPETLKAVDRSWFIVHGLRPEPEPRDVVDGP